MKMLKNGAGEDSEPVLIELFGELRRICRQISVRAELDPLVPGLSNLLQEHFRRDLFRVAWKPDSPRVRCAADGDRGHITSL
jgi:hypothetical protein